MAETIYNILEMRRKRAELVKQARDILEKAEKEKRDLTAEEEQAYNRIFAEVDELGKKIEREERLRDAEKDIEKTIPVSKMDFAGNVDIKQKAFRKWIVGGISSLSPDEVRALNVGADASGGYLVAPEEFVAQLIKKVDDSVFIRKYATIMKLTSAKKLGVPVLESNPDDADWTSELQTGSADTGLSFGKRELTPHPLAKRILISNQLLRTAAIDPEALVRDRLAYKFAITLEKAYLTGNGSGKPLGLFVADANGIPNTRDVVCGSTTEITADGLIDVKYSLKEGYQKNAVWILHRDAVKQIRKLKDAHGQYLWAPGLAGGAPDTLLDRPLLVSEYAPNTFTAGQYVVLYGDLSYYWIVDTLELTIQRLVELYAETNQTGFIARYEGDGAPVLAEAFVRGKLASS